MQKRLIVVGDRVLVKGEEGEDLGEKQTAEMGLMPVVANEASEYAGKRLCGKNATWAGGELKDRPRNVATMAPENACSVATGKSRCRLCCR